jgi:hypothetical protein
LSKVEKASFKDLANARYARRVLRLADIHYSNRVLQQLRSVAKQSVGEAESEVEKRAVIKVMLFSAWVGKLFHHKVLHQGDGKHNRRILFNIARRHNKCYYRIIIRYCYVCVLSVYNKNV